MALPLVAVLVACIRFSASKEYKDDKIDICNVGEKLQVVVGRGDKTALCALPIHSLQHDQLAAYVEAAAAAAAAAAERPAKAAAAQAFL